MKHLILALSAVLLLAVVGSGEIMPGEQARASVAAHRREAKDNAKRNHHYRGRHRHHHRRHPAA